MASCGEIEPLTPMEQSLLEAFKTRVKNESDPLQEDEYLVRWLIARDWDLNKAEKMYTDSMEWRRKMGANEILDSWQVPEVASTYLPGGFFGHDKLGHPIWYELVGRVDMKGVMFSIPKKDIMKFRIHTIETLFQKILPEQSAQFGKFISKAVAIVDLEGIGRKHLWKPAIDAYTESLAVAEANYPEALYAAYVVNVPKLFPVLWTIVKPFLAPSTRNKIKILGSNWKEVLQRDIDADQIPVHWGGTATDPDGDLFCKSKVNLGGTIPESYRLNAATTDNVSMAQFSTLTVSKGSSVQLDYDITQPGCLLRWNFWTEHKDIGFGVYLRTENSRQKKNDMIELVANTRVNSHMVPEADTLECETVGTYVIRFDNTYSWIHSKKVSYLIEVVLPDVGEELQRMEESVPVVERKLQQMEESVPDNDKKLQQMEKSVPGNDKKLQQIEESVPDGERELQQMEEFRS